MGATHMRIVLAHDHFDAAHLAAVQAQMTEIGAPTIKAVWMEGNGEWMALEGCHRLRAALALGITPEIDPIEWSEDVTTEDIGTDHQDVWTIAELCEHNIHNQTLVF